MNIISLFSGAGGMDLGFEEAGFKPVIAYDLSQAAVDTYNFNRKRKIAQQADLSEITAEKILSDIGGLHSIRGVVGGPPCQYFSNGNRTIRQLDDPRRMLPVKYASILTDLNTFLPLDFFILENVAGLAKPAHEKDFQKLLELFQQAGFHVSYTILDAHKFGVAQYRKRVFIVGWNKVIFPPDQYSFPEGEPSGLTVRDLLSGLAEPEFFSRDADYREFPEHPNHWTMNPVSEKFRHPPPSDLRHCTRSFKRLSWDEPSYTVAYGHNEIHVHPEGHRRLSIYEAMLLQGFPAGRDGYQLMGTLSEQVTLVSDAVPPPLSAKIARSFREYLLEHRKGERVR